MVCSPNTNARQPVALLPVRVPDRPVDPSAGLYHWPPLQLMGAATICLPGPAESDDQDELLRRVIFAPSRRLSEIAFIDVEAVVTRPADPVTPVSESATQADPPVVQVSTTDVIDARSAEVIVERIADAPRIERALGTGSRPAIPDQPNLNGGEPSPFRTRTVDGVTNYHDHAADHDAPSTISLVDPRLSLLPPAALEQFKLTVKRAAEHGLAYLFNEESLTDLRDATSAFTLGLRQIKGEPAKGRTPLASWQSSDSDYRRAQYVERMVNLLRACVSEQIAPGDVTCDLNSYVYVDGDFRYVFREWYRGDALIVQARTPGGYSTGQMVFNRAQADAARQAALDERKGKPGSERSPFAKSSAGEGAPDRIAAMNEQLAQKFFGRVERKVQPNV